MHFLLCQSSVDFFHRHELFNLHDLTRDLRRDGVEDCSHPLPQTKSFQDAMGLPGEANGASHELDSEICHGERRLRQLKEVLLIVIVIVFEGVFAKSSLRSRTI